MQATAAESDRTPSRIDVTDLGIERVREYARARSEAGLHFERVGGRAYLVAEPN
jgi:hypothetical protein